jgi:carboxymethylenebutenolidase
MVSAASSQITIDTPDGSMPAHLWRPPAGSGPGLVLVQEIFGVSDYIRQRAADLAELGYVVCAPEVYWRLNSPGIDFGRDDVLDQALALASQVDWPTAVADVSLALRHLSSLNEVTGGVGLVGFCFGGGLAFHVAAVTDPDVLVSYYGSALGNLTHLADQVRAPSLHHFGLADAYITADTRERVTAAVTAAGARVETYADAGHAFDNPNPIFHHAAASAAAWRTTTRFLVEQLPTAPSPARG